MSTGTCHCLTHPMSQHSHLRFPLAAWVTRHCGTSSSSLRPSWGFVALFEPQAMDTSASPVQHRCHISLLLSETVRLHLTSKIHQEKKASPGTPILIIRNCFISTAGCQQRSLHINVILMYVHTAPQATVGVCWLQVSEEPSPLHATELVSAFLIDSS